MSGELTGRRIAFLVAPEGAEESEFTEPWRAVMAAGGDPELVSLTPGRVRLFRHLTPGESVPVDRTVGDASVEDFDALVLPGGVANPDQLRTDGDAVRFVRDMVDAGRPVAVICHGPWTLVEADRVAGRTLTSWPSVRTDVVNAGGRWVDEAVVVCRDGPNVLVSSRKPDDLPAFCRELVAQFAAVPQHAS